VNALNVQLYTGIGRDLSVTTSFDLVPRSRHISDPEGLFVGDYLDAKLAYVEYRIPTDRFGLSLYGGKFESVMGREYRRARALRSQRAIP